MTIADDIRDERARLAATLAAAGPDATTLVGAWRARDLASHIATQDRLFGVPAFFARSFVRITGLRLTAAYRDRPLVGLLINGRTKSWNKSLEILRRPAPDLVVRARIAPITLWELIVHHEDVRRPNGLSREDVPDLDAVLTWLLVYNAPRLPATTRTHSKDGTTRIEIGADISIEGSTLEAVLWLSGRENTDLTFHGPRAEIDKLREQLRV